MLQCARIIPIVGSLEPSFGLKVNYNQRKLGFIILNCSKFLLPFLVDLCLSLANTLAGYRLTMWRFCFRQANISPDGHVGSYNYRITHREMHISEKKSLLICVLVWQ